MLSRRITFLAVCLAGFVITNLLLPTPQPSALLEAAVCAQARQIEDLTDLLNQYESVYGLELTTNRPPGPSLTDAEAFLIYSTCYQKEKPL